MTVRSATALAQLWRQSWFFRANVMVAAAGIVYLLIR
jgi:hypothetical protein